MNHLMDLPAMSMRDVVIAAGRSCPRKVPCPTCEYDPFCRALKEAYRQVQAASDNNEALTKFIEINTNDIEYTAYCRGLEDGKKIARPHGQWLHPYSIDIARECSICHVQMPILDCFNYCPNCGADMRKGERE